MKNKKSLKEISSEYALVYSTDPVPPKNEKQTSPSTPYTLKPAARIERKGRGGKSVTVLFKLPSHETLLSALAAYLKKQLGSGGTSYIKNGEGFVEIQGEHASTIVELATKFKWP